MQSNKPSSKPAGLIGYLFRMGQAVIPGFLVSMVLLFLTTELTKLGQITTERRERELPLPVQAGTRPIERPRRRLVKVAGWFLALVPTVLLGAAVFFFLRAGGSDLLGVQSTSTGSVLFEKTMLKPGGMDFYISNPGPQPVTIVSLNINDSILPFVITPGPSIPRFGKAVVHLDYPWVEGEAYTITLLTPDSSTFTTTVEAATDSAVPTWQTLVNFTLMGLGAGLLALLCGIGWGLSLNPARKWKFLFPMAFTIGVLVYSGFILVNEALRSAQQLGGTFQGAGLAAVGVFGTFLILDTIARWQAAIGQQDSGQRLRQAWLLSIGTGLRNFAFGLAVGVCFTAGPAALGTFLLVGFFAFNLIEGLRWMTALRADHPAPLKMLVWGVIGGAPAIFGIWTGAFTDAQPWTTLFIAIGGGAVFETAYEFYRRIQRTTARQPRPLTVLIGVMAGMLALYAGGLFL